MRQQLQRLGGDPTARRPLIAERKRLRMAFGKTNDKQARAELKAGLQAVAKRLKAVKTVTELVEPKSKAGRRVIALPGVTVAALRAHRVRQLEARMAAGQAWTDSGFVFTSSIGTACDPWNLRRAFHALLTQAELPKMRLHDLRHSCATLLLAQGVNPRVVMETLGHSQISLTLNTYSHVLPALQRDAAAKMDAAFG